MKKIQTELEYEVRTANPKKTVKKEKNGSESEQHSGIKLISEPNRDGKKR